MTHRQLMVEDSEQNIGGRGNAWTFLRLVMIHPILLRRTVTYMYWMKHEIKYTFLL
jgi:hypothetical protein